MAKFWQTLLGRNTPEIARYSLDQYANDISFAFNGGRYLLGGGASTGWAKTEDIESSFTGYINSIYKSNGVVFAIILSRMLLFSVARFCWFDIADNGEDGRPAGREGLEVLERPWPNASTGELLSRMEQDVSLGGNFYVVREPNRLRRLRPDWLTIVLTAPPAVAVESDVAGYWYHPGRTYFNAGEPAPTDEVYLPDEVAHFSPIPDPDAQYRGMSWLTPGVREIMADKAATDHKLNYFTNGATLGVIISAKENLTNAQFKEWKTNFEGLHGGTANAYKPLFLASPVDTNVTTATMQQLEFKVTQGAGETRLCAMGGVPPIIVGLSEGLASATYSNYGMARRKFGDGWAHPQWKMASTALANIVQAPHPDVRLGVNTRGIAFLREDAKDLAEIMQIQASAVNTFITAGYKPDSAAAAVEANDLTLLQHTGLPSVQLQKPGSQDLNGDGTPDAEAQAADQYQQALDSLRAEVDAHLDEVARARPHPGQKYRHGWIPVSVSTAGAKSAMSAEQARRVRELEAHVEKLRREGPPPYERDPERYVETELHARTHGLPIGTRIPKFMETKGYESLPSGHWRDPKTGTLYGEMGPIGWMGDLAKAEQYLQDLKDPDYWREHGDDAAAEIENLLSQARKLKMRRSEFDEDEDDLWRSDDPDEVDRSYYDVRVPKGFEGGGRFRSLSDRIGHALNEWLSGKGDQHDPLEPFTRDQLRKASVEFGVTPRRGASAEEIKLGLLTDARGRFRAGKDAKSPDVGKPVRFTLKGADHANLDVGVFTEGGKVSLWEVSDSGQQRRRVALVDDLAGLEKWANDRGESELAGWARKERKASPNPGIVSADDEVKDITKRLQAGEIDAAEAARLLTEHGRRRQAAEDANAGRDQPGQVFNPTAHGATPLPAPKPAPAKVAEKAAPEVLDRATEDRLRLLEASPYQTGRADTTDPFVRKRVEQQTADLERLRERGLVRVTRGPGGKPRYELSLKGTAALKAHRETVAAREVAAVGVPTERVAGRDITGQPDRAARILDEVRSAPGYNAGRTEDSDIGDPAGERLAGDIGYAGTPQLAEAAEFDRLVSDGSIGQVLYRGVTEGNFKKSAGEIQREWRVGRYHMGLGTFGNGSYMAVSRAHAKEYADGPGGLARFGLRKDARVVGWDDLLREHDAYHQDTKDGSPERDLYGDVGRFAMARGYDAISVSAGTNPGLGREAGGDQYVVLNRTAVIAEVPRGTGSVPEARPGAGNAPGVDPGAFSGHSGGATGGHLGPATGGNQGAGGANRGPSARGVATTTPDLASLRTLDTEHRRDALDLRKVGTVDEPASLKGMLKAANLPVSGKKRDLVDRLVEHLGGAGTPVATKTAAPAPRTSLGPGGADDIAEEFYRHPNYTEQQIHDRLAGLNLAELKKVATATNVGLPRDLIKTEAGPVFQPLKKISADDLRTHIAATIARDRKLLKNDDKQLAGGGTVAPKAAPGGWSEPRTGDAALSAPLMDLAKMADDPRADALWYRSGDNSIETGTGLPGAFDMANQLRTRQLDAAMKARVAAIDSVMKESPLPGPILVYRGIDTAAVFRDWENLVGKQFTDRSFVSTTTDAAHASDFGGTVMRLRVPAGTNAIRMADRGGTEFDQRESEVLLDRGLRFRITAQYGRGELKGPWGAAHVVDAEVVP